MRLFVALDLPWEVKLQLAGMAEGLLGARWLPAENMHLTLRFIGEVPSFRAEEIDAALAALRGKCFELNLQGVGTFSKSGRDVTLWTGVERSQALELLQGKIETALQRAGLELERRRFTPHVTLARLDATVPDKLASFVQRHNLMRIGPIPVEHFTLISSRLGKEASVYTPEVDYALG